MRLREHLAILAERSLDGRRLELERPAARAAEKESGRAKKNRAAHKKPAVRKKLAARKAERKQRR